MERTRCRSRGTVRILAVAGILAAFAGCVERRYTIRTNVPGALAIVNGEEVGPTPASRNFTYYGPREITILADGFETLQVIQPVRAPWWDNYVTEFFAENLIPFTLRDEREFYYELRPATNPSTAELQNRAESLRRAGQAAPPPRRAGVFGWLGF